MLWQWAGQSFLLIAQFFYCYPYLLAVFGFINMSGSFLQSSKTTLMLTKKNETSNDTILQNLAWLHVTWWRQVYKRKSVGHLHNCDVVTQLLRCNTDVCLLLSCTGSVILSLICIHAVLLRGVSRCSVQFYPLGEILKAVLVSESLTLWFTSTDRKSIMPISGVLLTKYPLQMGFHSISDWNLFLYCNALLNFIMKILFYPGIIGDQGSGCWLQD